MKATGSRLSLLLVRRQGNGLVKEAYSSLLLTVLILVSFLAKYAHVYVGGLTALLTGIGRDDKLQRE